MPEWLEWIGNWLVPLLLRIWPYVFPVGLALVVTYLIFEVMNRLDDRRRGNIGLHAGILGVLFPAMIFAYYKWLTETSPYAVSLNVLATASFGWSLNKLMSGPARPTGYWAKLTSPPIVFPVVCGVLVGLLWVVDRGITAVLGGKKLNVDNLGVFLAQVTSAGVFAMATIQGIRSVLPVRGAFHRASMERWILDAQGIAGRPALEKSTDAPLEQVSKPAPDAGGTTTSTAKERSPVDAEELLQHVVELATSSRTTSRYAFFDLPIEQLCGQIAAGADRLLDDPPAYLESANTEQAATAPAAGASAKATAKTNGDRGQRLRDTLTALSGTDAGVEEFVASARGVSQPAPSPGGEQGAREIARPDSKQLIRMRANVSIRIQRNIDRFQIETTFWWKRLLRGLAFTICAVLGLVVLQDWRAAVMTAIVGGFIATLARDVVAIVEKERR